MDKSRLDIGFLFASPLVIRDSKTSQKAPVQIDFIREAKIIKESVKRTGKAVKFLGMVATEENFD